MSDTATFLTPTQYSGSGQSGVCLRINAMEVERGEGGERGGEEEVTGHTAHTDRARGRVRERESEQAKQVIPPLFGLIFFAIDTQYGGKPVLP